MEVDEPDWYCTHVLPGHVAVDVVRETPEVLAFRPPVPGFGTEHIIVVPRLHVRSLLELDPSTGAALLQVLKETSAEGGPPVWRVPGHHEHGRRAAQSPSAYPSGGRRRHRSFHTARPAARWNT
ncbi:hypothetical protein [Streptomyces neyagawaensis]|uniref:hypothetical protein n=1 Tax=Streptomyces neyagawaensis TaxID=42238 RepID=UPI0012FECEEB|nr:hypothetical protein [Streptomyces neyagawaensis]MCL6738940.1 hypothetical protein [Streptomyces neyagawaensis]MDE1688359.1 hypothetical protein [Streptomyces neyagawaensis]MDG5808524.1 hypothetical protein [Streptomyces ossamyceticus]